MRSTKIFTDTANLSMDSLIDGETYLLFDMYGDFIAITTWEADNGQFDDKFTGRKYFISNADFIMRKPTYEQLTKC